MTFGDGCIRLKLLGYDWCEYIRRDIGAEIHFIDKGNLEHYLMLPPMTERKRHMASYIYSIKHSAWTKERSPLDAMPITPTERVLYGKKDQKSS